MIRVEKRVLGVLPKCYSVAPLIYNDKEHLLVAAEKNDACLLFDLNGRQVAKVWDGPGGTMSMAQVPGSNGVFLATQLFYSPNDSCRAKIVIVRPQEDGSWEVKDWLQLPFVHRFDIVERSGVHYLVVCTLKSNHRYENDWESPGQVLAARLPETADQYCAETELTFVVLKDGLYKNHGYNKMLDRGIETCIVSAENGVFRFVPPEKIDGTWYCEQLLHEAASDAVWIDLDGDGERELAVIAPFHGDEIKIYKNGEGGYREVYHYEPRAPFSHSIFAGRICGRVSLIIGHRRGARNLLLFHYDRERQEYQVQCVDQDCGSANIYHFVREKTDYLLSANRETDEIALYCLSREREEKYA